MIDTFHPLQLTNHAISLEDVSYLYSWHDNHTHLTGGPR